MEKKKISKTKEKLKGRNGITLIALVITIIVLLILAGVTIASITGENGILSKATNARDNNVKASAEERVKTEVLGSYGSDGKLSLDDLNNNLQNIEGLKYNEKEISDDNKIEELPATVNVDGYDVVITEQGNVEKPKTVEDAKSDDMLTKNNDTPITVDNKIVKIPAGFKVADDSGNTIDEGIVIEDSEKNQFVWVPVSKENFETEFIRREGYLDGNSQEKLSECGEADATGVNTDKSVKESETTKQEAINMYASVKRNEGFYIGRYEAGKNSNGDLVFQKGVDVYSKIPWSAKGEIKESDETTGGAVELSRNFANSNNYKTVTSTLIYGVQWDAVMKWMENVSNPNVEGKTYIQDSTGMGWYSDNYNSGNSDHKTGIDIGEKNKGSNQVKKIYDLAGNVSEWTMESAYGFVRSYRGGNFGDGGMDNWNYPASSRNNNTNPSLSFIEIGFRSTLFLNN